VLLQVEQELLTLLVHPSSPLPQAMVYKIRHRKSTKTRTPLMTQNQIKRGGKVSSYLSTGGSDRASLAKHQVINHEREQKDGIVTTINETKSVVNCDKYIT